MIAAAPGTPAPQSGETVSGAALLTDLPTVNEHAAATISTAAAAPAPAPAPAAPSSTEKDSLGRAFDSAKFRLQKDRLGRWKNLRGGRKPGVAIAKTSSGPTGSTVPASLPSAHLPSALPSPTSPPVSTEPMQPSSEEYSATAEGWLALAFPLADAALSTGGELMPDDQDEHARLRIALADYLKAKGVRPTTPLGRLISVVVAFVWKRVHRPNLSRFIANRAPAVARMLGIAPPPSPAPSPAPKPKDVASPSEPPSKPASATAPAARDPFLAACLPRQQ